MQKLLLVDPIFNPGNIPPSVSLGKIEAAFLGRGVSIELSDFVVSSPIETLARFRELENSFIEETAIKSETASVVYISAEHGNELKPYPIYPRVARLIRTIRDRNPKGRIVVGGALINLLVSVYQFELPEMKCGAIDDLVLGQSLQALAPIAKGLRLDGHPSPALDYTRWENWDFRKYPTYASVQLRSGCAYKCDFCFEGKIYDKRNLAESADSVAATIEHLKRTHGISNFILEDSVVLSYRDFPEIVERLSTADIRLAAYARVTEIVRWPNKLAQLKGAGASCVIVGIETLDNQILSDVNKQTSGEQSREALSIARAMDLDVQGCFMLGFPTGGIADSLRTIDFAVEQRLNCYRWHVYMPNYKRPDESFFSKYAIRPEDVMKVQVDLPPNLLLDAICDDAHIGFLDQHSLIRALHSQPSEAVRRALSEIGYSKVYTYEQLRSSIADRIVPIGKPLDEDEMYPLLFSREAKEQSVPEVATQARV